MAHAAGKSDLGVCRLIFDRRLKLEFHGASVTSDAGLLAYCELDDALGLTTLAGAMLFETRRGKNTRHMLVGLLRQSVFGRLAGHAVVSLPLVQKIHQTRGSRTMTT
jgi:Transposase DDE domain group 1